MINEVRRLAKQHAKTVISYRRHLHANPELSFHEFNTAAFIKARLDEIGVKWMPMANTGIVAMITGDLPSTKVIALRADIDALPITEANKVDYVSQSPGVMHACGHDAHTASLLGVATMLQTMRSEFAGTVKLIFQPGEELLPGGAGMMISEGVLLDPVPDAILGLHVSPFIAAGKIGIRSGKFMASMDEIKVTIKGKGGHAAQPHRNIDPVMIAAQVLVALQQIVSRYADPTMPSVLSFGKVIANGAINIIPDDVYMEGTFRTFDEKWRSAAHEKMTTMAVAISESMGAVCDFRITRGYPFLVNNHELTEKVFGAAVEFIGLENIEEPAIWMAAEDFASYSHQLPACFYLLGVGNNEKGINSSLHTPTFDIDESALELSIGLMTHLALVQLGN